MLKHIVGVVVASSAGIAVWLVLFCGKNKVLIVGLDEGRSNQSGLRRYSGRGLDFGKSGVPSNVTYVMGSRDDDEFFPSPSVFPEEGTAFLMNSSVDTSRNGVDCFTDMDECGDQSATLIDAGRRYNETFIPLAKKLSELSQLSLHYVHFNDSSEGYFVSTDFNLTLSKDTAREEEKILVPLPVQTPLRVQTWSGASFLYKTCLTGEKYQLKYEDKNVDIPMPGGQGQPYATTKLSGDYGNNTVTAETAKESSHELMVVLIEKTSEKEKDQLCDKYWGSLGLGHAAPEQNSAEEKNTKPPLFYDILLEDKEKDDRWLTFKWNKKNNDTVGVTAIFSDHLSDELLGGIFDKGAAYSKAMQNNFFHANFSSLTFDGATPEGATKFKIAYFSFDTECLWVPYDIYKNHLDGKSVKDGPTISLSFEHDSSNSIHVLKSEEYARSNKNDLCVSHFDKGIDAWVLGRPFLKKYPVSFSLKTGKTAIPVLTSWSERNLLVVILACVIVCLVAFCIIGKKKKYFCKDRGERGMSARASNTSRGSQPVSEAGIAPFGGRGSRMGGSLGNPTSREERLQAFMNNSAQLQQDR